MIETIYTVNEFRSHTLLPEPYSILCYNCQIQHQSFMLSSGVPRGGVWGVQTPPRNSEDIGAVLDRMSKKNRRRLDFLL